MNQNPTRRHALAGIAAALAADPAGPLSIQGTKAHPHYNQSCTSIHYQIDFHPSPERLYQTILDQKQFAAFSGMIPTIDPTPGGAFSLFGGLITGRNVELIPNPSIVQAWRPGHWDPGIYSIVHFEFQPHADETTLVFDHTGFPAAEYDHLDWGWYHHYWEPLKKFLA